MFKEFRDIKGVFVQPKKRYYLGRLFYGTPYMYPINFVPNILSIRKLKKSKTYGSEYDENGRKISKHTSKRYWYENLPISRSKNWILNIFGKHFFVEIGFPILIHKNEMEWKNKYGTPSFGYSARFQIFFFYWQFCIFWDAPYEKGDDTYFEMILWYLYYSDKNIIKAKNTWEYINYTTKLSTWDDDYLLVNVSSRNLLIEKIKWK